MPILAVILGIAFLGESLSGGQIAGAGLIAVGIVVGATALGTDLNGLFNRLATKLNGLAP